jgi:glycosyltransferase involved in cell wall biosynthesis
MKLVFVGPGIMPIPPPAWGAVEILIWDISQTLQKNFPLSVSIVNTPHIREIIHQVNELQPDIVHIHYDEFYSIIPYLSCKHVILTSHYGYIEQKEKWFPGYYPIFEGFVNSSAYIHCMSEGILEVYKHHGVPSERLFLLPNGANQELFQFYETPSFPDKTLYLGKIEGRKRQAVYQQIPFLYFVGNYHDPAFQPISPNYLGEWTKPMIYENMSKFANLALLSDGEAHPLVVVEALMCGLGVVVSEYAAGNLDKTKPFVTIIPKEKLDNINYVQEKIIENQKISLSMRKEIRAYGLTFSWNKIVKDYYEILINIVKN